MICVVLREVGVAGLPIALHIAIGRFQDAHHEFDERGFTDTVCTDYYETQYSTKCILDPNAPVRRIRKSHLNAKWKNVTFFVGEKKYCSTLNLGDESED